MRMPSIISRKTKFRASTARRSRNLGLPDEMDYEQMSEPNMKLSRALLIVLVLHIVAVAGIVAFNTIKTRENATPPAAETEASAAPSPALASEAPAQIAPQTETTTQPVAKPAAPPAASAVHDSGKIYTVVKGDNPVTIARHLKVSEADLLELNQITDPRKLQINQKLRIPEPAAAAKHKGE